MRKTARHLYLVVAFVAGWVIMMEEILAGRVLAPHFGYSIYQWGALIGVVMAALAIGYLVGGRLGDSPRSPTLLFWCLFLAACLALGQTLLSQRFVPATRSLGPAWGAVVASAGLVAPLVALLATVSPMVIRLTFREGVAHTAGRVYAVSTVGSIGGTFFAAFYAIPVVGTRWSHYLAAVLVALLCLGLALEPAPLDRRRLAAAILLVVATAVAYPRSPPSPSGLVYQGESIHNSIQVTDVGTRRNLYLNYTASPQTLLDRSRFLTGQYFDNFLLTPALQPNRQSQRLLFLGVAGGVALRQLLDVYPDLSITGVELDPEVLEVARAHFGLDPAHPRLELVAADARFYLERSQETFDIVCIDLFVTGHVPFFCATQEFFQAVHRRLSADELAVAAF